MFDDKKILAVIPARGGSKGVPRKNLRSLGDKPLLAWTIEAAKQSKYIDRLILSSEDAEIIQVAKEHGCDVPFVRPSELAGDDTPGVAPVIHAVKALDEHYDYLVLLQPTSPFRSAEDIDEAIRRCVDQQANACVSVSESDKHPAWMHTITEPGFLSPVVNAENSADPRQNLEKVYALNGAVYVVSIPVLLQHEKVFFPDQTLAYPMPSERSWDIDTEFDFLICELLAERMGGNHVL